jgi:hypothetical protein
MDAPKTLGNVSLSQYGLSDILQYTDPPKQPGQSSTFRRILGSVAGGTANIFAPGIGSIVSSAIGGRMDIGSGISAPTGGLLGDSAQYLQLQQQIQEESRQFETVSAVLKSRHDAAMDAIRNMKS